MSDTGPTTRLFRVETLTPVHVGSGEDLVRDIDYYDEGGTTYVLDSDLVSAHTAAIQSFADGLVRIAEGGGNPNRSGWDQRNQGGASRSIGDLLRRSAPGLDPKKISLFTVKGAVQALKIRRQIRFGDGRPMLPGSSLKGALRTLLFSGWFGDGRPHGARSVDADKGIRALRFPLREKDKLAAKPLEERLFRFPLPPRNERDPKSDALRMLSVGDAAFATGALEVLSTRAVGTSRNTLTSIEALAKGNVAISRLTLGNSFLNRNLPFPSALPPLEELATWSRLHALHLLRGDRAHFERSGEGMSDPSARCRELEERIGRAAADEIFLRLGWGTGWRTMTGDLLTHEERKRIGFRLGKTRKVVLAGHRGDDRPSGVLGWVSLRPVSAQEAAAVLDDNEAPVPRPNPAPAFPRREEAASRIERHSDSFIEKLQAVKSQWGLVQGLVDEAQRTEDVAQRERRLAALAARLLVLFGGDKRRIKELRNHPILSPYVEKS